MDLLPAITPGELLKEEFLEPMGISQYRLAKEIDVPAQRIGQIVLGNRRITADTDLRSSKTTTPDCSRNRSPNRSRERFSERSGLKVTLVSSL